MKILITGAKGLVGSALTDELRLQGYDLLTCIDRHSCDLRDMKAVTALFIEKQPEIVFHIAGSVFGLGGNLINRAQVYLDNILINTNVIEASRICGTKKIIAMGTVAAYPESITIPVDENQIWMGPPHKSEFSYGHAKRAMLAQLIANQESYGLDYAYIISTNLFGPNDKFNVDTGHVVPSLIRKFHEAKIKNDFVTVWGTGSAARDFLYSKDMAKALVNIMQNFSGVINVASGNKTDVKSVVNLLANFFKMENKVIWDKSKPDGRTYYPLNLDKLDSLGFKPSYTFEAGLNETLNWFVETDITGSLRN